MSFTQNLYNQLAANLPTSMASDRRQWAREIVTHNVALHDLVGLLGVDRKVAYRFTWLLSDVAEIDPTRLYHFLPALFELRSVYKLIDYTTAFSAFWHRVGVPEEQEGIAIDLCFNWLIEPNRKVSTKYYSMWVLHKMLDKYPDLKQEFKISLESQLEGNTATFRKQAKKILGSLGN